MKELEIDIETRSDRDITKCGVYAYADSPYFAVTLFSVSVDGGEVMLYDLASGEKIPDEILRALADESIVKRAFNVNFERVCLSRYLRDNYPQYFRSYSIDADTVGDYLSPVGWQCTMIHCRTLGLPSHLAEAGAVLKLEQQKMPEGKALIKYFCVPYEMIDGVPQFHQPEDVPEKWATFKAYNKQDVEAELAIDRRLEKFPVPPEIWEQFYLDQEINDRGIRVDMELVEAALHLDAQAKATLSAEMRRLTGVENPNSVYQLLNWLESQGYASDSLGKKEVKELLKKAEEPVKSVLQLRLQLSKSSVKKYTAMQEVACSDHRARGCFSFYGAARTGRWAGRNIQLQNLPQNHIPDLTEAREIVKHGDYSAVEMLYDDVPDTLSQLIRTAFVPRPGYKFIVADFSAIEARVLAWLAGEQWRMDVFRDGGDIYCASASQMFGIPVVKHGINGHLRQKGKIAELALGYGGSVGALKAMGALDMGLQEAELQPLVDAWREANPRITAFWWAVDRAVKQTVQNHTDTEVNGIGFHYESGFLFITLLSGRRLAYVRPRMGENQFGGESVTYMGVNAAKKWDRLESYGPKFVENIVQAIARDLLIAEYFAFCNRLLKKEPSKGEKGAPCMIVFCAFQQIPEVIRQAEKYGFKHYQFLCFMKNYSPQVLKANMRIVGATEYALVLYRGRLPKFRNTDADGKRHMIFDHFDWVRDGKDIPRIHPSQKPVNLLKRLIGIFTDPGDTVIDPCAGSGSTLRAARELGRNSYGFEVSRDFYNKACEQMLGQADNEEDYSCTK